MMKCLSSGPFLAAMAALTACSSQAPVERGTSSSRGSSNLDGPSSNTDSTVSSSANTGGASVATGQEGEAVCFIEEDQVCVPEGFPFVEFAVAVSDVCLGPLNTCPLGTNPPPGRTTAKLTQPGPGKVCLAGTVAAGGWSQIILGFSQTNAAVDRVLRTFDAQRVGITQVAFTIDSPPPRGLTVEGAIDTSFSCPEDFLDCFTYGFDLMTGPNASSAPLRITASGHVTAPFTHFKQNRPAPVSQTFDPSAIEHFSFGVQEGPYDFCVSELQFLDVAGQVVSPG